MCGGESEPAAPPSRPVMLGEADNQIPCAETWEWRHLQGTGDYRVQAVGCPLWRAEPGPRQTEGGSWAFKLPSPGSFGRLILF